jgi:hypothetical protein
VGGVKNVNEKSIDYDLFAYLVFQGPSREDRRIPRAILHFLPEEEGEPQRDNF